MSNFQSPPPYGPPQGGPGPAPGHEYPAPAPGYDYPASAPGYDYPAPQRRPERRRDGSGSRRLALTIHTIADIAAGFLVLWILLDLLGANQGNAFVDFVRGVAEWLSWWARDIFTMNTEGLRVVLNDGLPALIYLALGHGVAAWVRRLDEG